MIGIIIAGVIGIIIGALILYFLLSPKVKQTEKLNNSIKEQNKQALEEYLKTKTDLDCSQKELSNLKINISNSEKQLENTNKQNQQMVDLLSKQRKEAETAANDYKKTCLDKANSELEICKQNYEKSKEEYKKEYLETLNSSTLAYKENISKLSEEYKIAIEQLDFFKKAYETAMENAKRAAAEEENKEFYLLQVSEEDIKEIKRLRDIIPYFRNARPIGKIIWESYYRAATNDLINRLGIKDNEMGIYKITNLLNKKIYIGQSVNISNRWKDHIKCGCGIDTPNNILYKAMLKDGIENFIFEKLENCNKDDLNDREKYWINFFHSQEYGYNMTIGGSKNN